MKNALRSFRWGSVLLVSLTVAAYLPALRGGFIFDDDYYVTENYSLRTLEGLGRIWTPGKGLHIESRIGLMQYYPLTFTSLWVQYHLWGLHPFGYHLVNVLLHSMNAVLLWRLLLRLEIPGSWWAAAIFALHPVQVESVAWITEFKNVSSGLFSLSALLAFLRFRPLSTSGAPVTRDWRFYAPAFLLFLCALLCKTAVCCLPVAVAVLMWWKLDRVTKWDILALVPLFLASLTMGLITARLETRIPESSLTGWLPTMVHGGLLAGRALWFYAGKVFWPHPLTFIYPQWNIDASAAWQYLFSLAALAVLIVLWFLRRRIGKGALAGVLCFAAMLLPVLGFFEIYFFRYSYVTDHFQYLACIGLIASTVSAGATIAQRAGPRGRDLGAITAGVLLLTLGVSTWRQTHIYKDLETLWRDTLAKNPNAWMAHDNLGIGLTQVGKFDEAIGHFEYTLRLRPDDEEAHYNLGLALWQTGKVQPAITHWERALQIKPDFPEVHNNLGFALMQEGRLQDAIEHYQQALRLQPYDARTHYNLGLALWQAGSGPAAIDHWELALRFKPDYVEAHYNLAFAFERAGKVKEAIDHYEQALRIKPDFGKARDRLTHLRNPQETAAD